MNRNPVNVGGVGITPPTYTISDSIDGKFDDSKSAEIDWFTSTFDKIEYKYSAGRYKIHENSYDDLDKLFKVLTADKPWYKYDIEYGRNNYKDSIVIGKTIRVQFYGPKNKYGRHTTMIDLSGEACDEFISRGGNFIKLFKLMKKWDTNVTRLDLAIDDKSGKEVNIYDLYHNYILNFYFTTPYHNVSPVTPMNTKLQTYTGFGIYFGTRGRNQLLIYDKKLEQESKGQSVFNDVWYRYEMRFTGGKAKTIMNDYLIKSLESQDAFNRFVAQVLYDQLDIKEPKLTDTNKNRWPTAQCWLDFLDQVKKIRIVNRYRPKQSIDTKKKWIETSVIKSLAQLFIIDEKTFFEEQLKDIAVKLSDLKDKDIEMINEYLKQHGRRPITKNDIYTRSKELMITLNLEVQ